MRGTHIKIGVTFRVFFFFFFFVFVFGFWFYLFIYLYSMLMGPEGKSSCESSTQTLCKITIHYNVIHSYSYILLYLYDTLTNVWSDVYILYMPTELLLTLLFTKWIQANGCDNLSTIWNNGQRVCECFWWLLQLDSLGSIIGLWIRSLVSSVVIFSLLLVESLVDDWSNFLLFNVLVIY